MTFKTDLEANLAENFFNPDEFGDAAIFTHQGTDYPINGIFDDPAEEFFGTGNVYAGAAGLSSSSPKFFCATSDVPGRDTADVLTIGTTAYKIIDRKASADGLVTALWLSKD